jgi:acetylornithine/N-succinyldiaminopimelate aminotransferase
MPMPALMPVYPRCDVAPVRGDGPYLFDADGRKWLDFASGIAVNILGHGHPHVTAAIQRQAATLMHVSNLYGSPQQAALAERLVGLTFGRHGVLHQQRRGSAGMHHQGDPQLQLRDAAV